jgi:hypothetical protein
MVFNYIWWVNALNNKIMLKSNKKWYLVDELLHRNKIFYERFEWLNLKSQFLLESNEVLKVAKLHWLKFNKKFIINKKVYD